MWGNINGSFYVDLQRAKVFNYDGAIKGPAFYSQPVDKILYERFVKKNQGCKKWSGPLWSKKKPKRIYYLYKCTRYLVYLVPEFKSIACYEYTLHTGLLWAYLIVYFSACYLLVIPTHLALWQAKQTEHDKVWHSSTIKLQNCLPKCTLLRLSSLPMLIAQYVWPNSLTALTRSIPSWDNAQKKPVILLLSSRKWLETDFQDTVRCRRAAVASKTCRAAAMSLANGIVTVLKAWNGICGPDEVFSMAVLCTGEDAAKHNAWQNVQISAVILTDPARVGMWSSFGYLRRVLRSPRWHRPLSSNHLRRR